MRRSGREEELRQDEGGAWGVRMTTGAGSAHTQGGWWAYVFFIVCLVYSGKAHEGKFRGLFSLLAFAAVPSFFFPCSYTLNVLVGCWLEFFLY